MSSQSTIFLIGQRPALLGLPLSSSMPNFFPCVWTCGSKDKNVDIGFRLRCKAISKSPTQGLFVNSSKYSKPTSTTTSVFEMGNLSIKSFAVETSDASSPPKQLLIVTPTIEGMYPVLLFLHGFYLRNNFYAQLLQHIASHGFIVVSPQLYLSIPPTGSEEVDSATSVTNWLSTGLQSVLPQNVEANLLKLALSGHSRGGTAAFALALGYSTSTTSLSFSVLLGIDPVAGPSRSSQTSPKVLTFESESFDLSIPVAIIGTSLGDEQKNCIFPPCAPDGVNHKEFFNECKPACCYFVATDYGHMDMLDDDPPGCIGAISGCTCKSGKGARDPMRRSVGGIVVAFLRAYLYGENGDLKAIVDGDEVAPITLDPIEYIEA